jgi:uncharacterized protein
MITELIKQIESHVTNLLLYKLPPGMFYHNINHTRQMVAAVAELSGQMLFNEWERHILQASAWFHDSGYCYSYDGHEAISMTLAGEFLRGKGVKDNFINSVNDCIRATKMPQSPNSAIQSVMCDADMRHLSLPDYEEQSASLRQEWAVQLNKEFSEQDWHCQNLEFLTSHRYFTTPAKLFWEPQKDLNINYLRLLLNE